MKLYEIKGESKIYAECSDGSTFLIFHHLDGAYSYCETEKGGILHLSVNAELEEKEDGYELVIPEENPPEEETKQTDEV